MKKNSLLSIIIPIYNGEKYLEDCLESILKAKSDNFEVIIINDGSTDKSYDICERFSKKDSRVKVITQENAGVSIARNNGIKHSKSDYIMFVDSDDILCVDWESILKELEGDDFYFFSTKLNPAASKKDLLLYIVGNNTEKICFAAPFSKIFKREFLIENKILFDYRLINGEDMLFNINCVIKCKNYKIIKKSFYNYRNFIGSATKRFDNRIFESDLAFQNSLKSALSNSFLEKRDQEEICLYCLQMAIYVLSQRIAYINNFQNANALYSKIYVEPYLSATQEKIVIDKKYHLFLFLYKKRFIHMLYLLSKTRMKIKSNKKVEYYFTNI